MSFWDLEPEEDKNTVSFVISSDNISVSKLLSCSDIIAVFRSKDHSLID